MINSRDVSRLRPDVAANCHVFVKLMKEAGYDVIITGTVRDDAYQKWCCDHGYAKTPVPSFHSVAAGLAFDICKNRKGEEYSNMAFWAVAGAIGKKLGFTWGGDWAGIKDRPHFQWDEHKKFSGTMVRRGIYPPPMPFYEGDDDMDINEVRKELTAVAGTGRAPSDWAKKAVDAFAAAQLFNGDGQGNYGCQQLMTREAVVQLLYSFAAKLGLLDKLT